MVVSIPLVLICGRLVLSWLRCALGSPSFLEILRLMRSSKSSSMSPHASILMYMLTYSQNPGYPRREYLAWRDLPSRLQDILPKVATRGYCQICTNPRASWHRADRSYARVRSGSSYLSKSSLQSSLLCSRQCSVLTERTGGKNEWVPLIA